MGSNVKLSHLFMLAVLLLSACNLPVAGNTPQATGGALAVQTAAAQTVQALQTQVAGTPAPTRPAATTQAAQPTSGLPTAALSSLTPAPQSTQAPTAGATPCDRGSFVADVTVPDGTAYAAGQSFTKTWRLKNNGTCTWTTAYRVIFDKGDAMGGPATVALPNSVAPGQEVEISVRLTAPSASKEYRGDWKLQNANGQTFGVGSKADQSFWVKIVVGSPTSEFFAVTGGVISADPDSYTGKCPITLELTAKLTVSAPGTVTYFWERSDGGKTEKRSLDFSAAGTSTITDEVEGVGFDGYIFEGDYRLYVDQPNHQYFGPIDVEIHCD